MTDWSPQQSAAIKAAAAWLKEKKGPQVFKIFGYAGTGKSTIAKEIASLCSKNVVYGSFTGKAAHVMRQKGCDGAATLHSLIYRLEDEYAGEPRFSWNPIGPVSSAGLVIVDEVSMVSEEIGLDLLRYGKKVLVLGDPEQLPPVKGAGFFNAGTPDVMLTEIHRQAADNPIIAMATSVREGQKISPGAWGESKVVPRSSADWGEAQAASQMIVGLNRTRQGSNRKLRELHGRASSLPQAGDKLICLQNDKDKKIFNGQMFVSTTDAIATGAHSAVTLTLQPDDDDTKRGLVLASTRREWFEGGGEEIPFDQQRGLQKITFGYAITAHKAQGSQWPNVFIVDESASFRDDARRWLYTAITRASDRVTVVA